jgi:hypothetical protein
MVYHSVKRPFAEVIRSFSRSKVGYLNSAARQRTFPSRLTSAESGLTQADHHGSKAAICNLSKPL